MDNITDSKKDEEISIDFNSAKTFFKKYSIVFLILIPLLLSIGFRMMPSSLPITDTWAEQTIYNSIQNQVTQKVNQQYPNLPQLNKKTIIDKQFHEFLDANKDQIKSQIKQTSTSFKSRLQNDKGETYLIAIDPYYYYRETLNILNKGHFYDELKDGQPWNTHMIAPLGRPSKLDFHSWFGAMLHKITSPITGNTPMGSFFLIPVIISALAVFPAFMIGKKFSGNLGGFFAAMMIAVNAVFISRTAGGFSDTDSYNVFFPLLIAWLFIEAFERKNLKQKLTYASLAGLFTGLYSWAWSGWWYVFDFILGTIGFYLIYLLYDYIKNKKQNAFTFFKTKQFTNYAYIALTFIIFSGIFVTAFTNIDNFTRAPLAPIGITQLKEVGITKIWPNVYTTVAELNTASFTKVINQVGTTPIKALNTFLFIFAIFGIFTTMFKKDEHGTKDVKFSIFLTIWFLATLYATTTKGIRFALLLIPAYSVAFGIACGYGLKKLHEFFIKNLKLESWISITILICLGLLLILPPGIAGYKTAQQEIPSMNDAWYNTLTKINNESASDAIINSWWDFGHWFKAIGNRAVTFDGASQNTPMAYWIGKALLTSNEKQAIGILRMLDCGSNNAFEEVNKVIDNEVQSIKIINELILLNKENATKLLEKNNLPKSIINLTHCNAPEDYLITSDDMISKSGVWGHFGSWNFTKAAMFQSVSGKNPIKGKEILQNIFGLSETEADTIYYEITTQKADKWISPWPSYMSGLNSCSVSDKIHCNIATQQGTLNFEIDPITKEAYIKQGDKKIHPISIIYADKNGIQEKKFNKAIDASLILIGDSKYQAILAQPDIAKSMFTKLYFFNGHKQTCFEKFDEAKQLTGGNILIWKVDWNCSQNNQILFKPQTYFNASHILISTKNRTDEEALKLANEIYNDTLNMNFSDAAKQFSDGPSAQNGGNLGVFKKGTMVPEFEKALEDMEIGDISKPIKTQFGYHIIKLFDKYQE